MKNDINGLESLNFHRLSIDVTYVFCDSWILGLWIYDPWRGGGDFSMTMQEKANIIVIAETFPAVGESEVGRLVWAADGESQAAPPAIRCLAATVINSNGGGGGDACWRTTLQMHLTNDGRPMQCGLSCFIPWGGYKLKLNLMHTWWSDWDDEEH